jgi:hypothetical protein
MMTMLNRSARVLLVACALLSVLVWGGAAHAQDSFGDQYGSPVDSGEAAIESAESSAPDASASAASASDASASGASASGASASAAAATTASGGITSGILPLTGGPLLPVLALGLLCLSTGGLLASRLIGRGRRDT